MAIKKIYGNVGSSIFKEEKTPLSQMKPVVKNALLELRRKVEDAIQGNYLLGWSEISCNCCTSNHNHPKSKECDISLWGVPLLPSKGHEGTNIILLKFLQAKDYKVYDAFTMLEKTLKWRNEFKTDAILDEEFEPGLEKMGLVDGTDKKGRPLLYTIHGALRENNLYNKLFGTDGNKDEFLRWKIQFLEKGMRKLNFKPGGVDSVILITDLKNAPGPSGKELRLTAKKLFISLFVDHYPEILYKHIVVNAPFWFYAYHATFSRVLSQRAKNNFVLARPSRVAKTLLKYIAPGNLPVHYGGLKRENDNEFSPKDCVSQIIVRGGVTDTIQIPIAEPGVTVVWDLTVVGWDVSYKEEFVPDDECSYRILIQKEKKLEANVRSSYYIREPGKILMTIQNNIFKKKKVFYRFKIKPTVPMYVYFDH